MGEQLPDPVDRDQLIEDEPELWEYFARGAPVVLRENLCPQRHLVNNKPGLFYGLDFNGDENTPEEYLDAYSTGGFRVVTLDEAPSVVLVRVGCAAAPKKTRKRRRGGKAREADDTDGYFWHGCRLPDLSGTLPEGVVPNDPKAQVIPLLRSGTSHDKVVTGSGSRHQRTVKLVSFMAALKAVPDLITNPFSYELAFAITDFKIQGMTLLKLLINLPAIGGEDGDVRLNAMTFAGLYVLFSRGVSFESLRWLQCDAIELAHLPKLRPKAYVLALEDAYDENGRFSRERFKIALRQRHRNAPPPPKKRRPKTTRPTTKRAAATATRPTTSRATTSEQQRAPKRTKLTSRNDPPARTCPTMRATTRSMSKRAAAASPRATKRARSTP